jgi:CubicO group peptidase (beta-lactamase class C family)
MDIFARMKKFNVPGVGVTYFENGKIQWNTYYGTLDKRSDKKPDENSVFHACSISKMITALCVLRLSQDGILDLHKDVNEYLTTWKIPQNEFSNKKAITLSHLLSHQAGFYDIDGSFEPYVGGDDIPKNIDILKGTTRYNRKEVIPKYIPETDFNYSDAGYCVIEQIFEDVLNESIIQIAKRLVFNPLELRRTFFWEIGKSPSENISIADCAVGHGNNGEIVDEIRACYPNLEGAALWTTTSELARIVIDIINAFHNSGGIILNQDTAKLMLTPFGCVSWMGLGVFLSYDKNGEPYFFSQGWGVGMQCKVRAYYKQQRGVVVMTNSVLSKVS